MTEEVRMTVRVVCKAASHSPHVARLGAFIVTGSEGGPWRIGGKGWGGREPILEDEYVAPWEMPRRNTEDRDRVRYRYSMKCRMCHLHVQVRDERLLDIVQKAASAGVSVLSLEALAAIL